MRVENLDGCKGELLGPRKYGCVAVFEGRVSWMNNGRCARQNSVACQSIHLSASKRAWISSGQRRPFFVFVGKVADNDVGLPEMKADVLDRGDKPVGIEGPIARAPRHAIFVTRVNPFVLEVKFSAAPEHFLDIYRIGTAPDLVLLSPCHHRGRISYLGKLKR